MRWILIAALIAGPNLALAAGGGGGGWGGGTSTNPPPKTQTTKTCKKSKVWDPATQRCVNPRGASLDQDTLYTAMRELAYAGRVAEAQAVLALMADQQEDRVLTYWGFTHRKLGNRDMANAFYSKAIARNPDNILARSYMGQGFVEDGDIAAARAQLQQIRMRGGAGTWAETSLQRAVLTGQTYDY